MKKSSVFIILLAINMKSFAQENNSLVSHVKSLDQKSIKVLVSCASKKNVDFVFNSSDFLYFLNADGALGPGGATFVSEVDLPKKSKITMHGSSKPYKTASPQLFSLRVDRLQAYLDLRNSKENPFPEFKKPKNLGDVLQEFQEMTSSGCDFLVPTRFYTMLQPSGKEEVTETKEKQLLKTKEELTMCRSQLDLCMAQSSGVVNSFSRDATKVVEKVKIKPVQRAKTNHQ